MANKDSNFQTLREVQEKFPGFEKNDGDEKIVFDIDEQTVTIFKTPCLDSKNKQRVIEYQLFLYPNGTAGSKLIRSYYADDLETA